MALAPEGSADGVDSTRATDRYLISKFSSFRSLFTHKFIDKDAGNFPFCSLSIIFS